MLSKLSKTHQAYFNYLLTNPIPGYHNYRAGNSLLFLFPYYIQVGLAQLFYVTESLIIEEFNLKIQLESPTKGIELSHLLLNRPVSPITSAFFNSSFDLAGYNKTFGFSIPEGILTKDTKTFIREGDGIIGFSSLSTTDAGLLPRERLENFFTLINYEMDSLDKFIDICIENNRISAALIFCQYFKYPGSFTQEIVNNIERWIIDN